MCGWRCISHDSLYTVTSKKTSRIFLSWSTQSETHSQKRWEALCQRLEWQRLFGSIWLSPFSSIIGKVLAVPFYRHECFQYVSPSMWVDVTPGTGTITSLTLPWNRSDTDPYDRRFIAMLLIKRWVSMKRIFGDFGHCWLFPDRHATVNKQTVIMRLSGDPRSWSSLHYQVEIWSSRLEFAKAVKSDSKVVSHWLTELDNNWQIENIKSLDKPKHCILRKTKWASKGVRISPIVSLFHT